ncbi:MAG: acyl CoA:acetate/3-ketoacid CoA transferase [Ramlibacter sp.]
MSGVRARVPGGKFLTAEAAVALIKDGDTVALCGGGGGLMEASHLMEAVERRFLATGHPRNLTAVHSLGIGDKAARGMNRFAHEGLVRRVIGGHWVWSPRMQAMARDEKIEAYSLPGGVIMQLYREIAAGRPGLFTHVGLGTFVDPRLGGGKLNRRTTEDLVEVVQMDHREYLRYKPFPINVTLIRGSYADAHGNISLDDETANLEIYQAAVAAHNSGGIVIAQVRTAVEAGTLRARSVRIPGAIVDAVVVDPKQSMGYDVIFDPMMAGLVQGIVQPEPETPVGLREVIARRARMELFDGAVINYGFGMPDGVARLVARRGDAHRYYQTVEHGNYGGDLLIGEQFGFVRNPSAMLDGPSQFDFYAGGGLDIAFLGFGEADASGNVNVSKLGGLVVGPGGFIDIAHNARKTVFCGSFDAKGTRIRLADDALHIDRHGEVTKFVRQVAHITFAGQLARQRGQRVLYVTERAVFELTDEGVVLTEVAPGVDVRRDVLERMDFTALVPREPKRMPVECFSNDSRDATL